MGVDRWMVVVMVGVVGRGVVVVVCKQRTIALSRHRSYRRVRGPGCRRVRPISAGGFRAPGWS